MTARVFDRILAFAVLVVGRRVGYRRAERTNALTVGVGVVHAACYYRYCKPSGN